MRRLVALDLPGGPDFVARVTRCFDDGDAICPIDQRLSTIGRRRIIERMRPAEIIDSNGITTDLPGAEPVEEDDCVVIATSGTTGLPKGVVLTNAAVRASAEATSARLGIDPASDHWLCSLPLSHIGGLSVILRSLVTGTPLTVIDRFDAQLFDDALKAGANLTSLVPTTLARLGSHQSARFRKILLGGSALPTDLPENAITTYGMTETGSGVIYDSLPLDNVEIRFDASGEIFLRCPMLLRAYRDGTDPKDAEGFYATGDVGRINEAGCLEVFGRTSELIISGGENIWPVALEQLLANLPSVKEIAIASVKDHEWGERVIGLVVPRAGLQPQRDEMNLLIKEQIGPWAVLKELITVESLPRTAIGKLDRSALGALVTKYR